MRVEECLSIVRGVQNYADPCHVVGNTIVFGISDVISDILFTNPKDVIKHGFYGGFFPQSG